MTYDNRLNLITSARAALSREGFERLMRETNRSPTADQVCHAVERERLTDGAPTS